VKNFFFVIITIARATTAFLVFVPLYYECARSYLVSQE